MHTFILTDASQTSSPSLLIGWATVQANLRRMLALAGSASRLRPHMKTHKTREITQLYLEKGFRRKAVETLERAALSAPDSVTRDRVRAKLMRLL